MMTKVNPGSLLTYPVFRLGDSPWAQKIRRVHEVFIHVVKVFTIGLPALTLLYILAGFYLPSTIAFSTSDSSCTFAPSLAPGTHRLSGDDTFAITAPPRIVVAGKNIFSTHLCAHPVGVPNGQQASIAVSQLGLPFQKSISVTSASSLYAQPKLPSTFVSTKSNLVFELSEADHYFDYALSAGGNEIDCRTQDQTVICPTRLLNLDQGKEYDFELKQVMGGSSQALFGRNMTTVTSVDITSSSIIDGSIVYEHPSSVQFITSKSLTAAGPITLRAQDGTTYNTIAESTADGFVVRWSDELPRDTDYEMSITSLTATDGGHLEQPYVLRFRLSGGPKVTGSSLPSVRAPQNIRVTLTFDQPIAPDQDLSSLVSVTRGSANMPITVSAEGTQLYIKGSQTLGICEDFTLVIADTVKSTYGNVGGSAYSQKSRTQCSREFSIGKSVLGRSIVGYELGSGSQTIVYLGALHGNEKSGYYLLSSWLDYLEQHPEKIPAGRRVIILPKLNPDGFAINSRFNANNVDLNRNFASANWKPDVIVPGGAVQVGAGGSAPLSEPESKQLVDYLLSVRPYMVMSYHSQGSITIPNDSGNSSALAYDYARAVGYQYVSAEASLSAFEHETTGALEDWLHEVPDIPVILNELSSHTTGSIYPYHQAPMLKILQN